MITRNLPEHWSSTVSLAPHLNRLRLLRRGHIRAPLTNPPLGPPLRVSLRAERTHQQNQPPAGAQGQPTAPECDLIRPVARLLRAHPAAHRAPPPASRSEAAPRRPLDPIRMPKPPPSAAAKIDPAGISPETPNGSACSCASGWDARETDRPYESP